MRGKGNSALQVKARTKKKAAPINLLTAAKPDSQLKWIEFKSQSYKDRTYLSLRETPQILQKHHNHKKYEARCFREMGYFSGNKHNVAYGDTPEEALWKVFEETTTKALRKKWQAETPAQLEINYLKRYEEAAKNNFFVSGLSNHHTHDRVEWPKIQGAYDIKWEQDGNTDTRHDGEYYRHDTAWETTMQAIEEDEEKNLDPWNKSTTPLFSNKKELEEQGHAYVLVGFYWDNDPYDSETNVPYGKGIFKSEEEAVLFAKELHTLENPDDGVQVYKLPIWPKGTHQIQSGKGEDKNSVFSLDI